MDNHLGWSFLKMGIKEICMFSSAPNKIKRDGNLHKTNLLQTWKEVFGLGAIFHSYNYAHLQILSLSTEQKC